MMQDKMMMRKKAMESMMKDAPSIEMKKQEMPMEEGAEQEGFVSMMVSPEEKEMILEARLGGESSEEEMMPEMMPKGI